MIRFKHNLRVSQTFTINPKIMELLERDYGIDICKCEQDVCKNKFNDMEGKFITPVYNTAIINNGLEPHGVAPVSYGAKPRLTFQIFLDRDSLND